MAAFSVRGVHLRVLRLAERVSSDKGTASLEGTDMGCCLGVLLLAGAPRIALLLWWFTDPARVVGTFSGWATTLGSVTAPGWIWPLAGLVLLPWATVAYVFVAPGGLSTLEWVVLGIALIMDLSTHGGGGREYQKRRSTS